MSSSFLEEPNHSDILSKTCCPYRIYCSMPSDCSSGYIIVLGLHSRFEDKPLVIRGVFPRNGTAVLNGLRLPSHLNNRFFWMR